MLCNVVDACDTYKLLWHLQVRLLLLLLLLVVLLLCWLSWLLGTTTCCCCFMCCLCSLHQCHHAQLCTCRVSDQRHLQQQKAPTCGKHTGEK